jgi:hypothetical protein
MSTAHGAGLMVAPVLLGGATAGAAANEGHDLAMAGSAPVGAVAVGVLLHVLAMLTVMACVAWVVYTRLGVDIVRRAWINTDVGWAAAFVLAGGITLFT